ncbi:MULTISPECIES: helix-turn-helix transcriptional regulator [Bosea]|jgi:DNA-binding Xre family transcriptional regulator|uniref:Fis family transcriptional regulator n=1 Tax=Bosea vaviloviae TaxID=1526658 RepID=A0A0N1F700_9HYPH|nr:helix-turn-helix transcriptional regulator [Bosea vaviloviae]KPH81879.1 Fis family transcriptional regulator [Bosea vaviloviae]
MSEDTEQGRLGQSFDDFLKEDGIYEEVAETAVKRVIAWQLSAIMQEQKITKVEMARRLATSRAQLNRLLDPNNDSVTLGMLSRAAKAVGRHIRLELA